MRSGPPRVTTQGRRGLTDTHASVGGVVTTHEYRTGSAESSVGGPEVSLPPVPVRHRWRWGWEGGTRRKLRRSGDW